MTDDDGTRAPPSGKSDELAESESQSCELDNGEGDEFALSDEEEFERVREKVLGPAHRALEDGIAKLFSALRQVEAVISARVAELEAEAADDREAAADFSNRDEPEGDRQAMARSIAERYRLAADLASASARSLSDPKSPLMEWSYSLVRAIERAFLADDPSDLEAASTELKKKAVRRWRMICEQHVVLARTVYDPRGDWLPMWLSQLPALLAQVDGRAAHLTAEQLLAAWRTGEPKRLCARLAAQCGAFGYHTEVEAWALMRKHKPDDSN